MNKQWIYRNGEKPFSVTEIELPSGQVRYVSVTCTDSLRTHGSDGRAPPMSCCDHDLIPYEPYSEYVIDDVVYVGDFKDDELMPAHWSGLDENGKPTTFINGGTSFTRSKEETIYWKFCEKANKEDK